VLLAAATGKLADRARFSRTLPEFSIPRQVAPTLAVAIPLLEIAAAALLLPARTAVWGASLALGLLLVFSAAVGVVLRQGRRVDCHCFGQLGSRPVGRATLVRNAGFMALALVVLAAGPGRTGPGFVEWLGDVPTGERALVIVGLVLVVALVIAIGLLASLVAGQQRLLAALADGGVSAAARVPAPAGLSVGSPAPAFALTDAGGREHSLPGLLDGAAGLLLVFVSPGCPACDQLLPDLMRWAATLPALRTVLITVTILETHTGALTVLLDRHGTTTHQYRISATPTAVAILPDGLVSAPPARGQLAIRHLMAEVAAVARNDAALAAARARLRRP